MLPYRRPSIIRGEYGDHICISVRDTGRGIPPDMLPRIFDLFVQVERDPGRAQGGLGIGLTLVKSLVEMHGGSVDVRSEGAGRGSEFVVRLPLGTTGQAVPRSHGIAGPANAVLPRGILVADDNRDSAKSLGMLLKLLGADVLVVYSGWHALEVLAAYQPDVVFLDIGMPGMDGYEVAQRIRNSPMCRATTLIALTGWGQEEDRLRSQAAGFDYHLIKPADFDVLQSILTSVVDRPAERRTVLPS